VGLSKDLVDILQGEVRKNRLIMIIRYQGYGNYRFICGDGSFKCFPQDKAEILEAVKSNSKI
jgi:hypothetical protein